MIFFELIHIVAVIATAFLMMAVSTVWYSTMLFGNVWTKSVGSLPATLDTSKGHAAVLIVTFCCYLVILTLLSYVVTIAPMLSLNAVHIACFVTLFAWALFVLATVAEGKPLTYYIVNGGFLAVLIIGGTLILKYWPW